MLPKTPFSYFNLTLTTVCTSQCKESTVSLLYRFYTHIIQAMQPAGVVKTVEIKTMTVLVRFTDVVAGIHIIDVHHSRKK